MKRRASPSKHPSPIDNNPNTHGRPDLFLLRQKRDWLLKTIDREEGRAKFATSSYAKKGAKGRIRSAKATLRKVEAQIAKIESRVTER